ncbi:MAG TPA: hypothetical protein PKA00_18215 [Saprospiraceae bacterium]|nr:hypothetical protein [Saprospiraceae bacterium]HMQ84854.1 hypothetical protein [Saprospiraceae bacterium]
MRLKHFLFVYLWCAISACFEPPKTPAPSDEEVYAIQDSICNEMLLRISRARQEINRQYEQFWRRSVNAEKPLANQLKTKMQTLEKLDAALLEKLDALQNDSLRREWLPIQQELDVIMIEVSHTLQVRF